MNGISASDIGTGEWQRTELRPEKHAMMLPVGNLRFLSFGKK
jgi:hypothetical protein